MKGYIKRRIAKAEKKALLKVKRKEERKAARRKNIHKPIKGVSTDDDYKKKSRLENSNLKRELKK